jgi:galactose mutarotase-like enzyme
MREKRMTDMTPLTIANGRLSAAISTTGAELQRLTDADGGELLWDGDPAFWTGRAPILFPIIGLLAGGEYRLDGKTYRLPKHGFARHADFAVAARSPTQVTLRLDADAATLAIYPFEFRLEIDFALDDTALALTARVANRGGQPMPASFGFHPALRWPLPYGQPRTAHRLLFEQPEPEPIRRIDAHGLLTPDLHPTPVAGRELVLRDDLFVDDALIFDRLGSRRLRYGARQGPQLDIAFDGLPQLGVWTKPGAGYICIEPWQGYADPVGYTGDFRDKPGVIEIAPGTERRFAMRIALAK